MIKKVLFRNGKKYYWSEGDLHVSEGVIKDLENAKGKVKSHTGKEFLVSDANFLDRVEKIKRGPQAMLDKDIGVVIANLGLGKESVVVEGGVGSGRMSLFLARICKKVHSYEIDEGNFNLAKKNFEGVANIELKNKDVAEVSEKNVDAVFLDVPRPWECLEGVSKCLKSGGMLGIYLPTIVQVMRLVESIPEKDFVRVKVVEILEREWFVEGQKVRPTNEKVHTVFLCFFRKI